MSRAVRSRRSERVGVRTPPLAYSKTMCKKEGRVRAAVRVALPLVHLAEPPRPFMASTSSRANSVRPRTRCALGNRDFGSAIKRQTVRAPTRAMKATSPTVQNIFSSRSTSRRSAGLPLELFGRSDGCRCLRVLAVRRRSRSRITHRRFPFATRNPLALAQLPQDLGLDLAAGFVGSGVPDRAPLDQAGDGTLHCTIVPATAGEDWATARCGAVLPATSLRGSPYVPGHVADSWSLSTQPTRFPQHRERRTISTADT